MRVLKAIGFTMWFLPEAFIYTIVLVNTFIRGCFMIVRALYVVTRELANGVQDLDWKTIATRTVSTLAEASTEILLHLAVCTVIACVNGLIALVWPVEYQQEIEATRAKLRVYVKFWMAAFGPRKALPASPTWPSLSLDSKWIPSFGYGGLMAFSSSTRLPKMG